MPLRTLLGRFAPLPTERMGRRFKWTVAAVCILAVGLRVPRLIVRWDEWALHYAAYNQPTLEHLLTGEHYEAVTGWVGLHPPLYPLVHSLLSLVWPAPLAWMLLSVAASIGAIAFMVQAEKRTLLPAFLLATDPVQIHYAAEVNNYPLAVLAISYSWWAFRTQRTGHLAVALILAGWTHILAGCVAFCIAAWHPKRIKIFAIALIGISPIIFSALDIGFDASNRRQPPLLLEASITDAVDRFSISWVVCLPLLFLAFSQAKEAAATWSLTVFLWFSLVLFGIAAPHQFPYATFLGVPAAVLLATAARKTRTLEILIVLAGFGRAGWTLTGDVNRATTIVHDLKTERGIDQVWSVSLPGDAIVFVRGPGAPDDDKRQFSPTLWRLPPWKPMKPIFTGTRADLMGQPYLVQGRRIYTFNHPLPALAEIPGEHVFTILYDGAEHNSDQIPKHPKQGAWERFGPDLVRGPTGSSSSEADASMGAGSDAKQPDPQSGE